MVDPRQLAALPFFHGMPQRTLDRIAQSATELPLPAGRTFVRQYDRATAAFFLLSGSVQILIRISSDDLLVGVLREKGQLIGWSTFRPPYRYTASVRCEGPTVVLHVPATVFEELFAEDPAFAYATLRRVAVSLANRYESARDLLHLPEPVTRSPG
jgi:CRP-like cAMP-binding protein